MKKKNIKTNILRILSLLLILSSIIVFALGRRNILGFAVAEPQATQLNYSVAVILLIAGLLLFLTQEKLEERIEKEVRPLTPQEARERVKEIAKQYERNKIQLSDAVIEIDSIADVKPVDYSRGYFSPVHLDEQAFTFESGVAHSKIPIRMSDMNKKLALFYGLLELTYTKQRRGLIQNSYQIRPDIQVKVGKEIESSKHHPNLVHKHIQEYRKGLESIFDKYLLKCINKK